jgi:hypothetical protein
MPPKNSQRASNLLASVTEELLGGGIQPLQDNAVRVENILLEMIRPDPVQPRRVLPGPIHQAFHSNRLTPTQALRELGQIAQVAARQKGHPFSDVMDLLPKADSENEEDIALLEPEEQLVRDLVNLAMTIRDDGQVNPLTVVDMTQGVTRLYRIETGERRYWATWLLRDFIPNSGCDGTVPCLVIAPNRASIFRQAKENTARSGLTAVGMARQAALLLITAHGYDVPSGPVENDFYRQALDLDLRGKREYTDAILSAMGGIGKMQFCRYKALLQLSDEALELADRHQLEEGLLRYVTALPQETHAEMIQQIITLKLNVKQVKQICEQESEGKDSEERTEPSSPHTHRLIKFMKNIDRQKPDELVRTLLSEEKNVHMARARLQSLMQYLAEAERLLSE